MRPRIPAPTGTLSLLFAILFIGFLQPPPALPAVRTTTLDSLSLEFRESLAAARYAQADLVILLDMGFKMESRVSLQVCDDAGSYVAYSAPRRNRIFVTRGDSTWTIDPDGRKYMVTARTYAEPADLATDDIPGLFKPPFSVRTLTPVLAPMIDKELEYAGLDTLPLNGAPVVCERWVSPDTTKAGDDPEKVAWTRIWKDVETGAIVRSWFKPEPLLPMTMRIDATGLDLGTACGEELLHHDLAGYERISSFGTLLAPRDLVGSPAPALDGPRLDGEDANPQPWGQGPVLVGFWATWCAPCREELDQLATLAERHEGGLRVVMVSKESAKKQSAFVAKHSLPFDFRRDADAGIHEAYEVGSIPALFVVDGEGIVRAQTVGLETLDELEALLREVGVLSP